MRFLWKGGKCAESFVALKRLLYFELELEVAFKGFVTSAVGSPERLDSELWDRLVVVFVGEERLVEDRASYVLCG